MKAVLPLKSNKGTIVLAFGNEVLLRDNLLVMKRGDEVIEVYPILTIDSIVIGTNTNISMDDIVDITSMGVDVIVESNKKSSSITSNSKRNCSLKIKQISKSVVSTEQRLKSAVSLIKSRISFAEKHLRYSVPVIKLDSSMSLEELTLCEARWMKQFYKMSSYNHGVNWSGRRDAFSEKNPMFLINSLLYPKVRGMILAMNLDPDLGFIHGHTKGYGFIYDIADVFKPVVSIDLAFRLIANDNISWEMASKSFYELYEEIEINREIVKIIKEIIN